MLPMKDLRLSLGTALAADAATLAPAALGNKVFLIAAAFTPSEDLVIGDLTQATFTGGAPLTGGVGTQPTGIDPATAEQVIFIEEPVLGWRWICTAAPAVPETIYGYGLMDNAGAVLLGVAAFPTPIAISAVGHYVEIGDVTLRLVLQPMS